MRTTASVSKSSHYLWIIHNRIYHSHFGANTFFVLFLTTNEGRANVIKSRIQAVVNAKGYPTHYAKRIAVRWTPNFDSLDQPREPGGFILTEPWKRACGFPDLFLDKP